jgi:radical SAM family uncharacterized protein
LDYRDKIRRLLSEEKGGVFKSHTGKISIALAYPNAYRTGMSNLGFQNIYYLLNREEDVVCERVFLPDRNDVEALFRKKTPFTSFESQVPLTEFDILAFSVSFENDYINILTMLHLAKIPFHAGEREYPFPLIIAGGVCVFYNPEPLTDFIDLFIVGEGEEVIGDFVSKFRQSRESGEPKNAALRRFAAIEGIYVPSGYRVHYHPDGRIESVETKEDYPERIKKRCIRDVDRFPSCTRIFTKNTGFSGMYLVEIERGCGRHCNFCAAGHVYDPLRYFSKETIMESVKQGLESSDKIGLVGSSLMDHPHLEAICKDICDRGGKISVSSLRVDSLSEGLLECLEKSGQKTLTFALEAGTERLRKVINKELTEEEILEGIRLMTAYDIPHIKLYFLIGIPSERDEDIEAIISLSKKIKHSILKESRKKGKIGNITLSINPFVPKPFTPFQWDRMEDVKSLERRLKMIKNGLRQTGNVSVIHELPKWAFVQTLLSKGDRRTGKILLEAYHFKEDWRKTFQEVNINPEFYVYRKQGYDEILPWDHLDVGVKKEYLMAKRKEALKYE